MFQQCDNTIFKNNKLNIKSNKIKFCLIYGLLECLVTLQVAALTVDNQLVSARNDCFERIALEAMLPFEKAFRTEDTNSLKNCKEKCLQAGDKCQSISFGVHRRGNGTCQLSGEKYSLTGGRPNGIIFDPDFDLYGRKTNCFDLSDNSIPFSDVTSSTSGGYSQSAGPNTVPTTPPIHLPNRPNDATPILVVNPTPSTVTTTTSFGSGPTSIGYGATTPHIVHEGPASTLGPTGPTAGDHLYFSQDFYPLYKYPTLYEHNYPAPNDDYYIPGGYAANVPHVDADHYRPGYHLQDDHVRPTPNGPPRPVFGLGYGNGYSYGKPERYVPTTLRPMNYDRDRDRGRPNYTIRPGPYGPNDPRPPSERPIGSDNRPRPDYDYSPRPPDYNYNRPRPYDTRPSQQPPPPPPPLPPAAQHGQRPLPSPPPGDFLDYTNRPDPPIGPGSGGGGTGGYGTSMRPPMRHDTPGGSNSRPPYDGYGIRRNGTIAGPATDGYNYGDDKTIATYFNPEDYMPNGMRKRPYADRDRIDYSSDGMNACFRRVLAGKRIAPQWVRRTLICERVEDCMRECGQEKRFMCEGFNYHLDPSGHGQGDCELIDVPLAQMDLYSSPNRRDSSLLRHPDYDYYERDRNAPSSCRKTICQDCRPASQPIYFKPSSIGTGSGSWSGEKHYPDGYHSGYGSSGGDHYRPPSSTAVDRYSPPPPPHRLPPPPDYHSNSYEYSSHGSSYYEHSGPSSYGSSGSSTGSGDIDRYDFMRPDDPRYRPQRPGDHWQTLPSSTGYDSSSKYRPRPEPDRYRPPYIPGPNYSPYRPQDDKRLPPPPPPPPPPSHNYLDRDGPPGGGNKKPMKFVPYLIGTDEDWGNYGGGYGGSYNKQSSYWGLRDKNRRHDPLDFNYFELGKHDPRRPEIGGIDRVDYRHQWTRRPGPDECSTKTSEGFRLHKGAVRHAYTVPTLTECELLCSRQGDFVCQTFSYRYSPSGRDNCMLCDRPINNLDYYVDIEPDRDYDLYSMSDDLDVCRRPPGRDGPGASLPPGPGYSTAVSDPRNMQCFFRAIDATRFFKSIVRDSLTVRSVGECEMECIKSAKFTCRAFAFRYGQQKHASVIDNCQLSDWPVRDMDKERHLIADPAFDIFERASYGHGCEIQPIVDPKNKKLCYLGYGSPAKLLPPAIKKVISVPNEGDCKKECIRFRENTSFKCYSFSFSSQPTSYNCEMSDLDQTELKLNVHFTHTNNRDYWLFAWNPFDWTCRDKVNTIGGSRVNNDRRMDIFREPGDPTWRHYTVSGKACRRNSPCEKNLVTGFYSCEIDGAEIGSWDYCCKTDHPCGYSKGFAYPWCFVGDEPDQWRKCSDHYYPGHRNQTLSGITVPTPTKKGTKKKHSSAASASSTTDQDFQRPPRPGGLQSLSDFTAARLWPVTYLYSEGPPNSTEFSNFVDCNKESC